MFEQMAILAAQSTAALFIIMLLAMTFLGVFWAKMGVYRK